MGQLRLSDQELTALASDLESDRVERKERLTGETATKIREAICAFANDLPGHGLPGVVFVGLDDPGRPVRLPITDELLQQLADMRSDGNILPIPTILVEKRLVADVPVAVVTVAPALAPPVSFKGRIHIRVGPRRAIASRQDEILLSERRRANDLPFDLSPKYSTELKDLDVRYFAEEYVPRAVAPDILAANDRTDLDRLMVCRMILSDGSGTPTITGVLVCGRNPRFHLPGDYIQFLRVNGTDLSDPIVDAEAFEGRVERMYLETMAKLRAYRQVAVAIWEDVGEQRTESVPLVALEQILANAIMHRSYEGTNAPIRVTWFNDRIEVLSPGGPFGRVTQRNFGSPGNADYRNPDLAEAMRVLRIVQRFGMGIRLAQRAMSDAGLSEITWEVDDAFVRAVIPVRRRVG